ncbi:MAG: NUDIX domain-containing protein [Oscillospiraceae bacterium]|nr:NUDIX domain-containing protein [Oscillospiraceae bacterium]
MSIENLNFCSKCGKPLTYKVIGDEGKQRYCHDCNKFYFDNPASCVLVAIINENNRVLLLKQNYISTKNYTLCSGYLKRGDTLEETVVREVFEETEQRVLFSEYVKSYYYIPKNLIMVGFIAYVKESDFGVSNEVDELLWVDLDKAAAMVERENNYSGIHLDNCIEKIKRKFVLLESH